MAAYDPELADRVRAIVAVTAEAVEAKMMGTLCFLANGHIIVGVSGEDVFFPVGGGAALDLAVQRGAHRMRLASGRSAPFAALTHPDDDTLADWIAASVERHEA
ncbi:hypothetical protein [Microbacterium amylolyticum]|uniref:TfoX N-terminal domain-containing protein n=1 Tax=Microbacterium amylolyticum TaxID=936337 RepID=A0ABS4ZJ43_9MICO|nr:hypothetical protein [Microbacterium amylolyticum]MBP2436501.1 hypothetical protein [Microbacterium amylolyticum]